MLKLNIQKTKIMASSPITSWQIDGETEETEETVAGFIFGGSKITVDGDCSHDIKRRLLLGRKVMTSLAAAAKSLQSCLTLCDPTDGSPPGSPVPGILQARILEWANLDSILKSRDIILPTKVHLVKAVVFPVVMCGCESWTLKKADSKESMLLNCGVGEE